MDILQAIEAASSQDPSRAQAGLKGLETVQKRPGAFSDMILIAANRSGPLNVRRMAIIQFKNVATNQWRNRTLLSPEHRAVTRQTLSSFFDEEDDTIAQCSAVIIAKIFRIETVTGWPELLPGLADVINSNCNIRFSTSSPPPAVALILRRSVYTLNQIVKEISSVKLPAGVQLTSQIVKDTHPFLTEKYQAFAAHLLPSLTPEGISSQQFVHDMRVTHLLWKCLAKNIIWLSSRPRQTEADQNQVASFFTASATQYQTWLDARTKLLVQLRSSGAAVSPVAAAAVEQVTKHVLAFGKFFRRLQQPSIPKFVGFQGSSELVLYCWRRVVEANSGSVEYIDESPNAVYHTRVLLQGMVLFKDCLGQWTPNKQANLERGHPLLNQEFVTEAVTLIVTRFLPLKPRDLEKWQSDAEEWVLEETGNYESWEFDIRTCAERVLMTLLDKYHDFVAPLLVNALQSELSSPRTDKLPDVLRKEAIYFSIGGHFNRLRNVIDLFALVDAFGTDIQNSSPTYRILKRRIAWVLGKSAPEETLALTQEPGAKIWNLLDYLLRDQSESSDLAVRLSAALAIRERTDSLTFDAEALNPHLASIISSLMQLISEVDAIEAKTHIARTLNSLIERSEGRIMPCVEIITTPIPGLWASSGTDFLFKASMLDTMTQLILAAKGQSDLLHYIVVPMVQEAFKPEAIIQIDQEGLNLWLAALRNATTLQPPTTGGVGLIDLAPIALDLLANNLDLLGSVVLLVESYFLLDANTFLERHGLQLHQAIVACLGQAMAKNANELLVAIETMILLAPPNLWAKAMFDSGLFGHIINTITAGKGAAENLNAYIHVLARVIFADANTFLQMLAALGGDDAAKTLDRLLDQWWRQFDNMSEPRHRKLTAMAMGSLVSTGQPEILKRLSGETFNLWLDVLGEMKEALTTSDQENHLTMYWRENGTTLPDYLLKDSEGTLQEERRRQLYRNDPINSTLLTAFLRQKLEEGRNNAPGGPAAFDAAMQQADQLVVKQFLDATAR